MRLLSLIVAFLPMTTAIGQSTRPSATAPASAPAVRLTEREFDRLLAQLSHPRFEVRKSTTERLCSLDRSFLPRLAEHYRGARSDETRQRIRYVIETVFYRDFISGREGFLGMRVAADEVADPATGNKARGIFVSDAIDGFPAAEAGLRSGDTIIALNDRPLPDDPTPGKFIAMIARQTPGTAVSLRALRPTPRAREVILTRGHDDSQLMGLTLLAPTMGLRKGVRIIDVATDSPAAAAGLKVNEIIVAVNDLRVTDPDGLQALAAVLGATGPNSSVRLTASGVEQVTMKAVIGLRPLEHMDPADKKEVQSRFLRWWRGQGGRLPSRPEQDPAFFPTFGGPAFSDSAPGTGGIVP